MIAKSAPDSLQLEARPMHAESGPVLSPEVFSRIARRVKANTGIVLKDHKSVMVQARIARRLRELGFSDFKSYVDYLESPTGHAEITHFCNAITTNLTSFFRENHHFEHFERELQSKKIDPDQNFRIWSAGCSTGEEPYCISMVLTTCPKISATTKILATDLDTDVLAKGRAGRYSVEKVDGIPDRFRNSITLGPGPNEFEFSNDLKNKITFNRLNLLEKWPFKNKFDIIFCRNVLIYFDTETKMHLVKKFANALRPSGVLYLGHSETILEEHPLLNSEGRTTYRRST